MHYVEPNAYAEESKHHNKAMEKLVKDNKAWYEHTVEKANKLKQMREELSDAKADIKDKCCCGYHKEGAVEVLQLQRQQ